ncbi:LOW QUALITY PROTEIN: nucleolar MIF4G domain-containing protein 1 [Ailuropoda melanoleuca]|uniref:LOW QUALITY PROTEIN: nucleolar MIF4G domain-containing protein 1 n=1 Tax=Ailuropoda melanoleuca TaxID=9646 RepID=UPI001494D751|nr:LOW QUALITY PROTEIN: nucleolar MIF4G domain-containing protein 1 [Ailuropoda melanoleuca]
MAASASAGVTGQHGRRGRRPYRRHGRGVRRGPGGGTEGALKRLKLAVEEFVQASSEGEIPGGSAGPRTGGRGRVGGRKSRRELRKEKRHLKKARRLQRSAGPAQGPGPGGGVGGANGPRAEEVAEAAGEGGRLSPRRAPPPTAGPRPPQAKGARARTEARGPPGTTRPSAAAAAARKRALLAANEEEDREIRKLERCLGLNKRKKKGDGSSVPLSFARDGLDYILGALGSGKNSGLYESSREEEEVEDAGQTVPESDLESDESDLESGTDGEWGEEDVEEEKSKLGAEAGAQVEEEDVEKDEQKTAEGRATWERHKKRVRFAEERTESSSEDSDTADQSPCENDGKYIPPHVRQAEETAGGQKKEGLERLQKHVKGLINRLSEPSMASISGQLEELYMAHSRKDMNDTLTGVLLSACAPDAAMPSRLVMEHVLLLSVLHHAVGVEVGAHFLEAVVRRFDAVYKSGGQGKECENLLAIVAHLYNFHVVQACLVFDVLKKLIGTFTEKDIELTLLMLKNVGFSLRKDDALSLKELIVEAQAKASEATGKFQDQTRVRFMLETMLALKNNDMRKIPGYDPEPVEKLRKLQRALVRSASSGPETQLRVSWDAVLNAEHTGRWWIVGSAWSGAPMIDNSQQKILEKQPSRTVSGKILELARKQRMNTDVRRNIFCTIMTSEDFLDAFEKLLKLRLKEQQEREIVHVLVDCCLQEKTYNPFYAFLAGKFCEHQRGFQMTFQFSIWDKFRDLENLPATNFSNLVHLVAHLLKTKSLPLSILKVVEFSELDKARVHFLRKVLYILLMETEAEDLGSIFARVCDNPKLGLLREGLRLFISHFLLRNAELHSSAEEASLLRERADLSTKALQGKASLRM